MRSSCTQGLYELKLQIVSTYVATILRCKLSTMLHVFVQVARQHLSSNTFPCCKLPQDVATSRSHFCTSQHFPANCNTEFVAQMLQEHVVIPAIPRLNLKRNIVALQVELKILLVFPRLIF